MKKILAIILAAVLVLSFAACKKNDTNNDTTAGDAQTSGQAADVSASDDTASSEEASFEVETEVVTDKEGHTVIETKASQSSDTKNTTKGSTTPSKGLNTNDAAACIKAYQAAIAKTKQFKSGRQNMALKGSITADGSLGAPTVSKPQGTYMLFVDCTDWCKAHGKTIEDVEHACWDVGVAIQDGTMFFGPCHLRMNLASPRSRIEEAFHRMDKYVFNA